MMRVLGFKRIMILLALVLANGVFAALLYGYLFPEKIAATGDLRRLQGQISGVQTDISRIQVEFDQLEIQQARFEALQKDGFFSEQNRGEATELFNKIQKSSRVINAVADVKPGVIEDHPEATKAKQKILKSPVNLTIEALDDSEVFAYLYLLEKYFPGHITIETLEMERTAVLNAALLRSVATGANPPLIRASIAMSWQTMIPAPAVETAPKN